MKFGRDKKEKTPSIEQLYQVYEFKAPSSIPIEDEKEVQKQKLGSRDSLFDAIKKSYEKFGLNMKICYSVKDGILSIGAMGYSKEGAMKLIADQSGAIKGALNVEISRP